MSTMSAKPDYGVDAPGVIRTLFLIGFGCLLFAVLGPHMSRIGPVGLVARGLYLPAGLLIGEGLLFLLYVKVGKFRHRDFMLGLHKWSGREKVLDIGCGRGLLLVGAAKRIAQLNGSGHVTGVDVWSTTDMAGNSAAATEQNLRLEGVSRLCTLVSKPAQEMPFGDQSFDLVVSNLCLHNIYDRATRRRAVQQIARVLVPGGTALISDFKNTREYAEELANAGFEVRRVWGNLVFTFPPLQVVVACKSAQAAA
jgi:arsenite methyltransferase